MAKVTKPIVLDETLQSLVSTQILIKNIVSNAAFEPPVLLNKTISSNGVYTPDSGYDGFHQITVNITNNEQENALISRTLSTYTNDNITSIGDCAFQYCTNLNMVSAKNCTFIGDYTFANCYNLVSLYLNNVSTVTLLADSNAFTGTPLAGYSISTSSIPHIYVPSTLLSAFKTATNWSYFSDRFVGV